MPFTVIDYSKTIPPTKTCGISDSFVIEIPITEVRDNTQLITTEIHEITELSPIEIRDVEESIAEISQGKAKKFDNVDAALRWLKE